MPNLHARRCAFSFPPFDSPRLCAFPSLPASFNGDRLGSRAQRESFTLDYLSIINNGFSDFNRDVFLFLFLSDRRNRSKMSLCEGGYFQVNGYDRKRSKHERACFRLSTFSDYRRKKIFHQCDVYSHVFRGAARVLKTGLSTPFPARPVAFLFAITTRRAAKSGERGGGAKALQNGEFNFIRHVPIFYPE